jgi:hypothetical protein
MTDYWDKPCAAAGLRSYRYRGRYGWLMIGARDTKDALAEAGRSTNPATVTIDRLEEWTLDSYQKVSP